MDEKKQKSIEEMKQKKANELLNLAEFQRAQKQGKLEAFLNKYKSRQHKHLSNAQALHENSEEPLLCCWTASIFFENFKIDSNTIAASNRHQKSTDCIDSLAFLTDDFANI